MHKSILKKGHIVIRSSDLSQLAIQRQKEHDNISPDPSQKVYSAVMNYRPAAHGEISVVEGDQIEVLELRSVLYARVLNCRTKETGLIPVLVIGAEIVREDEEV
jgi:hypothetical protein